MGSHHTDNITKKSNSKRYFLVILKRSGVPTDRLLKLHITLIRPPAWHPGPPSHLSHNLEAVQRLPLRTTHPNITYKQMLEAPGVVTHRKQLCLQFARVVHSSFDFTSWFPVHRQACHTLWSQEQ